MANDVVVEYLLSDFAVERVHVVAVISAYLVVLSFAVTLWPYLVVKFVNFVDYYDGTGLSCSLLNWMGQALAMALDS